jgi:hypothetical protein
MVSIVAMSSTTVGRWYGGAHDIRTEGLDGLLWRPRGATRVSQEGGGVREEGMEGRRGHRWDRRPPLLSYGVRDAGRCSCSTITRNSTPPSYSRRGGNMDGLTSDTPRPVEFVYRDVVPPHGVGGGRGGDDGKSRPLLSGGWGG